MRTMVTLGLASLILLSGCISDPNAASDSSDDQAKTQYKKTTWVDVGTVSLDFPTGPNGAASAPKDLAVGGNNTTKARMAVSFSADSVGMVASSNLDVGALGWERVAVVASQSGTVLGQAAVPTAFDCCTVGAAHTVTTPGVVTFELDDTATPIQFKTTGWGAGLHATITLQRQEITYSDEEPEEEDEEEHDHA